MGSFIICLILATTPMLKTSVVLGVSINEFFCVAINISEPISVALSIADIDCALPTSKFKKVLSTSNDLQCLERTKTAIESHFSNNKCLYNLTEVKSLMEKNNDIHKQVEVGYALLEIEAKYDSAVRGYLEVIN